MIRGRSTFLAIAFLMVSGLGAEARFRADDGNFWHRSDNPALASVAGDWFALGASVVPDNGRWDQGTNAIQLVSPFLSFLYQWKPSSDSSLQLGTAMGPWAGLSIGYRNEQLTQEGKKLSQQHFGTLWRPADFLSAAITVDDAFSTSRRWGAGVAARPLTPFLPQADWLTLSADGHLDAGIPVWERFGARLSWRNSDVRVWYEPGSQTPGIEVTVGLGPSETSATMNRAGQAFRWSDHRSSTLSVGGVILRLRELGTLSAAPRKPGFFSPGNRWSVAELVDLLEEAATNPSVQAVAFEDPPAAGQATSEELRAALRTLQKAGKKVYIHAESYGDSVGYQGWVSAADRISLSPTGILALTSDGARRLYFKDLFDKIGVRFVNFAPWETKSANNPFTYSSMPAGEKAQLQRFTADRQALSSAALQEGRGAKLKAPAAELAARGPWLVAKDTVAQGLVDALESRADFEEFLKGAHPGTRFSDELPAVPEASWGPSLVRKTVAVVHLAGSIGGGPGRAGESIGRAAAEEVAQLRTKNHIHGLILKVDSPGGAVGPSDDLAAEVKKTVAAGKPVVVVMGDMAASGGYYISAPASRIFAHAGTLTGSIGVTAAVFTAEKGLEMLGIRADGVDQGPSAGFGDVTRPLSDVDQRKWAALIESTYDRFLDVVAEGRKMDKAKLEPLARGQIYTGREALGLGLVDALGGMPEAKAWLEEQLGSLVEYEDHVPGTDPAFGGLFDAAAQAALETSGSAALKVVATWDKAATHWVFPVVEAVSEGGALVWCDLR